MAKLPKGSASVLVEAPIEAVWALVTDVPRTGEWSPECERCEWVGGATGWAVGARFVGHNRRGSNTWDMECVVDEAEAPHRFSFHTERDGRQRTRWTWSLSAEGDDTRVEQSWERLAPFSVIQQVVERFVLGGREKHNATNLDTSLDRLKSAVEG